MEAAAAWHRAQEFRAQAQAASQAAVLLREAAGLTGTPPAATGHEVAYRPGDAHRGPWPAGGRTRYLLMTSGYPPLPEPFAEALGEAAQTAAMAYRLVMTISDAVRRATQNRLTGTEEELGEDAEAMAPGWSADQLRGHLGDDILAVLMQDTDWPKVARQLVGLQQTGVDLGTFLPQMGRMTAGVHQAVTANTARIKAEGTDRWADLLKATMPQGLVRDAILASPAWPDIAAATGRIDGAGIDPPRRSRCRPGRRRRHRGRRQDPRTRPGFDHPGGHLRSGDRSGDRPPPPPPLLPLWPAPQCWRGTCWPRAWVRPVIRGPCLPAGSPRPFRPTPPSRRCARADGAAPRSPLGLGRDRQRDPCTKLAALLVEVAELLTATAADVPLAAPRAADVLERIAARIGPEAAGALCNDGMPAEVVATAFGTARSEALLLLLTA
ncbi:hypothetical protein GCM10010343_75830 [Streptomyces avidinii]|nr:hypothetical protein GCM10010343_75830 [Streptomyces avidinii]